MQQPTNATQALSVLLTQWVDTIPEPRNVIVLNNVWLAIAEALCGSQNAKSNRFQQELAQLRRTPEAGKPPIHALEQRINELVREGIRELFLVIAIRQGLDQLIAMHYPLSMENWKALADTILPLQIQFAAGPHPSTTMMKPYQE
jgi:hypothetical protein